MQTNAALLLTQAKLQKDTNQLRDIAIRKDYNPKEYTKKLAAMMILQYFKKANLKDSNSIINDIQAGYINSTHEQYVDVNYESIGPDLSLSKDEQQAMAKVNSMMKEANKEVEFYGAQNEEEEAEQDDGSWFYYILHHKQLRPMLMFAGFLISLEFGMANELS